MLYKRTSLLILALVLALTVSCTTDGGKGDDKSSSSDTLLSSSSSAVLQNSSSSGEPNVNNGEGIIMTYYIKDITESSFKTLSEEYGCQQGILEKYIDEEEWNYEISGGTLTLESSYDDDQLIFNGTSNVLKGIWTKDKEDEIGDAGLITKVVFTDDDSLTFTYSPCMTDLFADSEEYNIIDCNNVEMLVGDNVITIKYELGNRKMDMIYTYQNKTCKMSGRPSAVEIERVCAIAIGRDYRDVLYEEFDECYMDLFAQAGYSIALKKSIAPSLKKFPLLFPVR